MRDICIRFGVAIGEVTPLRTPLVLGWTIVSVHDQPPRSTQSGHPSVGRRRRRRRRFRI